MSHTVLLQDDWLFIAGRDTSGIANVTTAAAATLQVLTSVWIVHVAGEVSEES